jgi:hypothetical protein
MIASISATRLQGGGCFVTINGEEVKHYIRHSPTGMEMGYAGSGPADMAYSILRHLFSGAFAERWYQKFKWDFVSKWQGDEIRVTIDFDKWGVQTHKVDVKRVKNNSCIV